MVVEEEGAQPPKEGSGEDAQAQDLPAPGGQGEEGGHRQGDAGGESVHPVGDVDGVHRPHHDEGGEDHIDRPGQLDGHLEEGQIEVGGQVAEVPQQGGKGNGGGQLEQKLGPGGEAGILPLFHLLVVVQIPDDPKDQGEEEDKDGPVVPRQQVRGADEHQGGQDAENEHQASHGGGALLGHVPGGAVLLNGLPGLHPAQDGDEQPPGQGREDKGNEGGDHNSHLFNLLNRAPASRTGGPNGGLYHIAGQRERKKTENFTPQACFRPAKQLATTSRSSSGRRAPPTSW